MKSRLSPANGASLPPRAAVSSARTLVVPTATTRPPRARQRSTAAHVSADTSQPFGVQLVVLDALRAHGRERAGADVQRQERALDAARRERVEHRRIEVQPRRRRRDGARRAREHGLVALAVRGVGRARDVRRQRRLAVRFEERHDVAVELDLRELAGARDDARPRAAGQLDVAARQRLVARAQVHERAARPEQPLEQQLDAPARGLARR